MSGRKKPQIQTAGDALVFLDYMATFTTGTTSARCAEIASVIRDLVAQVNGDYESEWLYVGSPSDVATALMQRAWDDDVTDDDRILLETAAKTLEVTLDRCIRLASVIEKTEVGL